MDEQNSESQDLLDKPEPLVPGKYVQNRHRIVAYMAASGAKRKVIAKLTGYTLQRITQLLCGDDKIKLEVKRLQYEMFRKENKEIFSNIFPQAIETQLDIMMHTDTRDAIKVNCAQDFMDRHAGKAAQPHDIGGNLLKLFLEKLDGKTQDPEPKVEEGAKTIDVTPSEPKIESLPGKTDFGAWVSQNL